jgi:hypothetical protein
MHGRVNRAATGVRQSNREGGTLEEASLKILVRGCGMSANAKPYEKPRGEFFTFRAQIQV